MFIELCELVKKIFFCASINDVRLIAAFKKARPFPGPDPTKFD